MDHIYGCSFFGSMEKEDITPEIENHLRQLFVYLIFNKRVVMFYTAGKTYFEFICTKILAEIREHCQEVSIIKISRDSEKSNGAECFSYDCVVPYENEDYKRRYRYILKKCRYVIIDTTKNIKHKGRFFGDIVFEKEYSKKDLPRIYMVDIDNDIYVLD